jgi:hypothetical protein
MGYPKGDTPLPPGGGGGGGGSNYRAKGVGTLPAVTLYYYKVGGCISTACLTVLYVYLVTLPSI